MNPLKFFIIVLLLAGHFVFGQTDSTTKKKKITEREFGMNVYAMEIRAGDFYTGYKTTFGNSVFNGLYYKTYRGKNVMRYSLNYFRGKQKNDFFRRGGWSEYSYSVLQLSAGYQRMFTSGKFAPYAFGDLSVGVCRDVMRNYGYYPNYVVDYYYPYNSIRNRFMSDISAGIGLRIKFNKHVLMNIETAARFYYQYQQINSGGANIFGIDGKPLTLGLGFIF